ncbi:MAG: hypothetical protein F4Z14_00985 [Gammaproteobacteria bacterium]|nr:hypothetical protein [Gammaproteobacteria bacterium]
MKLEISPRTFSLLTCFGLQIEGFEHDVVETVRSVNQDFVFKDLNDLSANSVRYGFVNAGL